MEMMAKKKFLKKLAPLYFISIDLNDHRGPYFKLSENLKDY